MKIVILDGRTLTAGGLSWDALQWVGGEVEAEFYDHSAPEEVGPRSAGATVLITNKAPVSAEVIAGTPSLRFIAVTATGYDCVDAAAARRAGVLVSNVPEYGTDSVAQLTFALLLELCHHAALHGEAVRAGEWSRRGDFSFWTTPLVELAGKTMGIVGFGRIGRRVGSLAHAFGMSVLAHNPTPVGPPGYQPFATAGLDDLFALSDVVTLHCPLTPQTAGLVNRDRLSLLRPTAFLLNTSRGGLVVDQDLADALNTGRLAGAALDVVSHEPIEADNPLLSARNCLITPHIAWATQEARRRLFDATVANVANFLAGRPTNVVNGLGG
jgi:glycerate dehydrogenase